MPSGRLPSSSFSTELASLSLLGRLEAAVSAGGRVWDDRGGSELAALVAGGIDRAPGLGLADGEVVGLFASSRREWLVGFWSVVLAGGVVLPLSPLYPDVELRALVEDAEVRTVLATPDLEAQAARWGADLRRVDVSLPVAPAALGTRLVEASRRLSPDRGALLLYTSGTTGRPKGALLSHQNLAQQTDGLRAAWGMSARDRLLHTLPLHHLHGIVVALLTTTLAGGSVRLLPKFDATRVWELFAEGEVDVFMGVPTMYGMLLEAFDAADPSTRARWTTAARALRLATSGSAALPVRIAERWRALTGAIPVERYGMTEIGIALTNPLEPNQRAPGRVGRPLPTVEVRLVDDDGEISERGPGELWVRGPSVFSGYRGRPDATAESFVDGWFRTGDVAERDETGSIRLLGRTSVDILKSGGYKLSALEIEEVVRDHPAVAEVAVVGIPDETWGDRVVAVVRLRSPTAELTAEAFRAFCSERLVAYKIPRQVVAVEALPKNAMGKVQKPELVRAIVQATPNVKNSP